jgi:hypothetical protein
MPIDRRITNGLAWAGAVFVVAIPLADVALRQLTAEPAPQVAVVQEERETVATPTPVAERPTAVVTPQPQVAEAAEPESAEADPITTAATTTRPATGSAVDDFIQSGRPLPSYISGGDASTVTPPARPATPAATPATPPVQAATPAPQPTTSTPSRPVTPATAPATDVAAVAPAPVTVTMPTPVSQRPPSVPRATAAAAPAPARPLIIEDDDPIITAEDLEDWESGPLSDFLAGRRGGGNQGSQPATVAEDYDPNGFFLDQGPNNGAYPQSYDGYYYPYQ